MIVKNEENNVDTLIKSLQSHINGFCVCDTGSTDSTLARMKQSFHEIKVKGEFVKHKWRNFAYNRNLCLKYGEVKLRDMCEYWLILDADQVLISSENVTLKDLQLDKDAYWLTEVSHGLKFSNMKILKISHPWFYQGVIHETIKTNVEPTVGELPNSIYTFHDTKHERGFDHDIRVMKEGLKEDPNDTRLIFHLAKALHVVNKTASVPYYIKRISFGETPGLEEVFWSKYSLGTIVESNFADPEADAGLGTVLKTHGLIKGEKAEFSEVVHAYEAAAADRAYRYEPWARLGSLFLHYKNDLSNCLKFAEQGLKAGPIMHYTLFAQNTTIYSLHHLACWCGSLNSVVNREINPKDSCRKIIDELSILPRKSDLEKAMIADAQKLLSQDIHQ